MKNVLEALLESWSHNNLILLKIVHNLPEEAFSRSALPNSMSIGDQLNHIHETRLFWLSETAPDFFTEAPPSTQGDKSPRKRLMETVDALVSSRKSVADAVRAYSAAEKMMDGPYSHPVLFLQHMLWHEAYHMGNIMLSLKGVKDFSDEEWQEKNIWGILRS